MLNARTLILLGKKLNNEATEKELIELAALLQDNNVEPHIVELLREAWLKKPKPDNLYVNKRWDKFATQLSTSIEEPSDALPLHLPPRRNIFSKLMIAAAVGTLVSVSTFFIFKKDKYVSKNIAYQSTDSIVNTKNGEKKRITLPDSTKVYLNSGSQLVFNKNFGSGNREVHLNGEAFFDVTKDSKHPFLVNTNRMLVKVLGTTFNVKAYNTTEDIETTVVEGKVEVSLKEDREKKVILLPSEKISIKNGEFQQRGRQISLKYEVETVRIHSGKESENNERDIPETAWINDKVIFTEERFETVALKMERWYNVRFHFDNEGMKNILMSGDFDNVEINEALQILQMLFNFSYQMKGNEVYIK